MFAAAQLKLLQEQKRRLLDESEARRYEWISAWLQINQRLSGLDRALTVVRRTLPFCSSGLALWKWWKSRSNG